MQAGSNIRNSRIRERGAQPGREPRLKRPMQKRRRLRPERPPGEAQKLRPGRLTACQTPPFLHWALEPGSGRSPERMPPFVSLLSLLDSAASAYITMQ